MSSFSLSFFEGYKALCHSLKRQESFCIVGLPDYEVLDYSTMETNPERRACQAKKHKASAESATQQNLRRKSKGESGAGPSPGGHARQAKKQELSAESAL